MHNIANTKCQVSSTLTNQKYSAPSLVEFEPKKYFNFTLPIYEFSF